MRIIRVGQTQCAEVCVSLCQVCAEGEKKSKLGRDSLPNLCAMHVFSMRDGVEVELNRRKPDPRRIIAKNLQALSIVFSMKS